MLRHSIVYHVPQHLPLILAIALVLRVRPVLPAIVYQHILKAQLRDTVNISLDHRNREPILVFHQPGEGSPPRLDPLCLVSLGKEHGIWLVGD